MQFNDLHSSAAQKITLESNNILKIQIHTEADIFREEIQKISSLLIVIE